MNIQVLLNIIAPQSISGCIKILYKNLVTEYIQ